MTKPRKPPPSPSRPPTAAAAAAPPALVEPEQQQLISQRKSDHLALCASGEVEFRSKGTLLDQVQLVHDALPDRHVDDVDLTTTVFGKRLRAPIMVSGTLCGRIATLPKPRRLPTTRARTRPAIPALMWTTVPPAKSIGATLAAPSVEPKMSEDRPDSLADSRPPPHTMCAMGK